jgi:hypothetical protein
MINFEVETPSQNRDVTKWSVWTILWDLAVVDQNLRCRNQFLTAQADKLLPSNLNWPHDICRPAVYLPRYVLQPANSNNYFTNSWHRDSACGWTLRRTVRFRQHVGPGPPPRGGGGFAGSTSVLRSDCYSLIVYVTLKYFKCSLQGWLLADLSVRFANFTWVIILSFILF